MLATQDVPDPDRFIRLFFSGSRESRAKALQNLKRISSRAADRDEPSR